MCCEIDIVRAISLTIGVNVQKWLLSPTVPKNKPYVHAYFRYLSKHCCVQNLFLTSLQDSNDITYFHFFVITE